MASPADSDDLFNLKLVRTATADVVSYSCKSRDKGPVDRVIVGKRDGHLGSPECLGSNGGTSTSGWGYDGWWHVFLVRVIELTGSGLVWVREVFVSDLVERSRGGDLRAY